MRVLVENDVFAGDAGDGLSSGERTMKLVALFALALDGRHRVLIDDEADAYSNWRADRDNDIREACDLALRTSRELEIRNRAQHELRITAGPAQWDQEPPSAPLPEALWILQEKFQVLLEDQQNDLAFLLSVAASPEREELRRRSAWWEPIHGGGGRMRSLIEKRQEVPWARLLLFVLFDSDARRPNEPGDAARRLAETCGTRIPHHCLRRRAIENYATRSALEWWSAQRVPADPGVKDRVRAFYRMPDHKARHHFNMKHGLGGDDKRGSGGIAEELYQGIATGDRALLHHGFPDLQKVFAEPNLVRTADLIVDDSFDELNRAVIRLLSLMR